MTPAAAAIWMQEQLIKGRYLYQSDVAEYLSIAENGVLQSDRTLTYFDNSGNLCISRKVLAAFRKLEPDDIVYERGDKCWRRRAHYDAPGRRQD